MVKHFHHASPPAIAVFGSKLLLDWRDLERVTQFLGHVRQKVGDEALERRHVTSSVVLYQHVRRVLDVLNKT